MRYHEVILELARETRYTPREIRAILRALAKIIRTELVEGRDAQIDQLGIFRNQRQGVRSGRHPETGERIPIPPTRRVVFRPCEGLREAVKGSMALFKEEDLEIKYGLKERPDGKVRSGCGSQAGSQGEEGRSR